MGRKWQHVVDSDKRLKHEYQGFLMKIFRWPIIIFLNTLSEKVGRRIFYAFAGKKGDTKLVGKSVASHKALEVIYTYPERKAQGKTTLADDFWEMFMINCRAVRSRLKITVRELTFFICNVASRKEKVNLLSLGSGSARGLIESLNNTKYTAIVETKLIDLSEKAIAYSKQLAEEKGVGRIAWFRDYAQNLENYCRDFKPDIVEMVGLLDYYQENEAIELIKKIDAVLNPGGWLITCNINPNLERPFVTKSIGWHMIYRTPEELADLAVKAGLAEENIKIIQDPFKIHNILIYYKPVSGQ